MALRKRPKSHLCLVQTTALPAGDLVRCYLRHSPDDGQSIRSRFAHDLWSVPAAEYRV